MILVIILSLFLLFSAFVIYRFIITPKKLAAYYQNILSTNFKVYTYPLAFMGASQFTQGALDQQKHKDAFKFYKEVSSEFDVTITNFADKVQLNLVSPKLMQAFYQTDMEKYYKKNQLIISGLKRMVGNGLTFSTGDCWKNKRRITIKLLNFPYIQSLVPKIQGIVQSKLQQLIKTKQTNQQNYCSIDILDLTTQIASTVVLQMFFGGGQTNVNDLKIKDKTVNSHMRRLLLILERQILTSPPNLIFGEKYGKLGMTELDRQVNESLSQFHNFTRHYIEKRLNQLKIKYADKINSQKMYSDLIEAFYVQEIIIKKQTITPQFIQLLIDDFATLYVAGTDTTSHTAYMAIYYIFAHPNIKQKLKSQIKDNIKDISHLTYQSFKNCILLQAIITQNLRLYSTANGIFPRQAIEDHYLTVGDIKIPIKKGTLINSQTISTHYKKQIYQNPSSFIPQRFIDKNGKFKNPDPFTLMNFSAGPRSCVGKQLAMTEMRIILLVIVNFYEISIQQSQKQMNFKEFAYNMEKVTFKIKKNSSQT